MDSKELKYQLEQYAAKHDLNCLSPNEYDFVTGSISFHEYLSRCYADYSSERMPRMPECFQTDQGRKSAG